MSVTIQGSFASPAMKLRRMVALSATWIAACQGAGLDGDPQDNVYLKNVIGSVPRPHAVISPGEKHAWKLVAGGDRNYLRPDGSLFLYMACDINQEFWDDVVQAEFAAASFFGSVIDDVVNLAGDDDPGTQDGTGHLALVGVSLEMFSATAEEQWESIGRFYYAAYSIEWGDG